MSLTWCKCSIVWVGGGACGWLFYLSLCESRSVEMKLNSSGRSYGNWKQCSSVLLGVCFSSLSFIIYLTEQPISSIIISDSFIPPGPLAQPPSRTQAAPLRIAQRRVPRLPKRPPAIPGIRLLQLHRIALDKGARGDDGLPQRLARHEQEIGPLFVPARGRRRGLHHQPVPLALCGLCM